MNFLTLMLRRISRSPRRPNAPKATVATLESLEIRQLLAAPQDPVVIQSVNFSETTTIIDWDPVDGADRYEHWFTLVGFSGTGPIGRHGNNVVTDPHFEGSRTDGVSSSYLSPLHFPGARRRVWIRAGNEDGFGPWGPGRDFILPGTPPDDKPKLNTIWTSFYWNANSFTVSWDSLVQSQGAATHEIWVAKDGTRVVNTEVTAGTFTAEGLDPGIYRFWVRGKSDQLIGAWSDGLTIAVGSTQPQLNGPILNQAPTRPEISWTAGVSDVPYHLWVQNESGVVINQSNISGTTFTPDSDLADGVYSAWVRQIPASGQPLPWSPRYQFAVGQSRLPEVPELTLIPNENGDAVEDGRAIFTWNAAANAVRYEIYISNRYNGNLILRLNDLTGTEFITDVLGEPGVGGRYRAWLRSIGANGELSLWSEFINIDVHSETNEVREG